MPAWQRIAIWRKRARQAEIQRDKLLRRCARADRAIGYWRLLYLEFWEMWGRTSRINFQNRHCVENAEAALRRWKRGMNNKDTQQVIDDALAFLGAMEGRKP